MGRHFFLCGVALVCLSCGGVGDNVLLDGGGSDGTVVDSGGGDGGDMDTGVDTGIDTGPPCDGLECQIPMCMNMDGTTITGTVYDPAGKNTIYNAFVYIPNRPLDPIATAPTCQACPAVASGKPLVSTTTDAKGNFTLKNVPAGANIPIVVQVGKFRHKDTLANVTACMPNTAPKAATQLPGKQPAMGTDDSLPQIAITTGCDWMECFLQRTIGIDPTEFTPPTGKGRVHVYKGVSDDGQQFSGTPGSALAMWGDLQTMKKYDILTQSCECDAFARDTMGMAYANMKSYLEAGGRFFGTHYHYNWFAPPTGPADFQAQATWAPVAVSNPPFSVDTTFPRGQAYSDWLAANMVGALNLTDTRGDVSGLMNGASRSRWIYGSTQDLYLTFNTPTTSMMQCGRVGFSDIHVEGDATNPGMFPGYCANLTNHDVNEKAMEFLFFDLAGCVQDDTKAAISPPTK